MAITLHQGIGSAVVGLLGGGLVMLLPEQQTWIGWGLVVIAGLMFLWGIRINGEHWWTVLFRWRLPPTLYLRNTEALGPQGYKSFGVIWIAEGLQIKFKGDGLNILSSEPTKEKTLTFALFNAGDEDVRHIELRWTLPGIDIQEMVRSSAIFGDHLQSADQHRLKMVREGGGGIFPFTTNAKCLAIPLIRKGESEVVEAPEAFTLAYSICALVRAKHHNDTVVMPTVGVAPIDPIQHLENWHTPMDEAVVKVSYVKGGRRCRHGFRILALVWGGSKPLVHRPRDDAPQLHEMTEGVVACVDNVTVIPDDR